MDIKERKLYTSAEVFYVIRARHEKDLEVYGSFSDPDGRSFGRDGSQGTMETIYSLNGATVPFIGVKTTWRIDGYDKKEVIGSRKHEYWIYIINVYDLGI